MLNTEIAKAIDAAKDGAGVITPDTIHKQLANMNAEDWQHAATMFNRDKAKEDGFYITDTKGKVTIHNDMTKANDISHSTAFQMTLKDVEIEGKGALTLTAMLAVPSVAGAFAIVGGEAIAGGEGLAALLPVAGMAAGAGLGFAGIMVALGAYEVIKDVSKDNKVRAAATNDIRDNSVVSFQSA